MRRFVLRGFATGGAWQCSPTCRRGSSTEATDTAPAAAPPTPSSSSIGGTASSASSGIGGGGGSRLVVVRPDLAAEWAVERNGLDLTTVTTSSTVPVFWQCPESGALWKASVYDRVVAGRECPVDVPEGSRAAVAAAAAAGGGGPSGASSDGNAAAAGGALGRVFCENVADVDVSGGVEERLAEYAQIQRALIATRLSSLTEEVRGFSATTTAVDAPTMPRRDTLLLAWTNRAAARKVAAASAGAAAGADRTYFATRRFIFAPDREHVASWAALRLLVAEGHTRAVLNCALDECAARGEAFTPLEAEALRVQDPATAAASSARPSASPRRSGIPLPVGPEEVFPRESRGAGEEEAEKTATATTVSSGGSSSRDPRPKVFRRFGDRTRSTRSQGAAADGADDDHDAWGAADTSRTRSPAGEPPSGVWGEQARLPAAEEPTPDEIAEQAAQWGRHIDAAAMEVDDDAGSEEQRRHAAAPARPTATHTPDHPSPQQRKQYRRGAPSVAASQRSRRPRPNAELIVDEDAFDMRPQQPQAGARAAPPDPSPSASLAATGAPKVVARPRRRAAALEDDSAEADSPR